ncbi:MAG: sensor histidine kinase [Solirubrobacteraceae bacterium]
MTRSSLCRVLPVSGFALTVALVVAGLALEVASDIGAVRLALDVVLSAVAVLGPAALGLRVTRLVPGNAVGGRLILLGITVGMVALSDGAVMLAERGGGDPSASWVSWAASATDDNWMWMLWAVAAVIWVFPDGRAPSARWALWGRAAGWTLAVLLPVSLLTLDEPPEVGGVVIPSPVDVPGWVSTLEFIAFLVLVAVLIGVTMSVRWRVRRASGIERLQLWWLAYAATLLPATIVVCFAELLIFGWDPTISAVLLLCSPFAISAAMTVAITRHRLYEIDRLVNRTLVYVTLSAALAATYAAIVVLVGVLLGGSATWTTALATLAVAVAFRPARDAAQRVVDRRFARRRYEGMRRVDAFLEDVRAGRAEPEQIGVVLARALDDRGLDVLFWLPATERFAGADGRLREPPGDEDRRRARTPVRRGDLELGLLLHDPALLDRPDTLDGVLRAAGLAMEIARLRVEVRVQLAEVEASRARIVAAGEAERRRLERDLHDGAQQRLVSLGLAVRHAQFLLDEQLDDARAALDGAVGEVTAALAELRQLAQGLRPALLDAGLAPALNDVARRAPVPVDVRVRGADGLDAPIEAAAFYVACEAMTNAVKHAGARQVWVRAERAGPVLRVEVADNGVGGARRTPGGGLDGLSDRVASHGGTFALRSPAGGGTTVLAELPCAG